jgi:hypothetical protein
MRILISTIMLLAAAGAAAEPDRPAAQVPAAQAPAPIACPRELGAEVRCYRGSDLHGAWYWMAIPRQWNNMLVVHSHGGPSLRQPSPDDALGDLKRFAVMLREGYAWAGSSYRHAGFGVQDAAEDTDEVRRLFWTAFGKPRRTLLHGQSWGGNVALRVAERLARDEQGALKYDGMLLTSGIVAGGDLAYDFRADLRAVYQYYCRNLPLPNEAQYPLWQGLGRDTELGAPQVQARVNACLGLDLPPARRSAEQARALHNIASVVRMPETVVGYHMNWVTASMRDLTLRQLQGHNPFSNVGVVYAGSDDDAALNRGVARFEASAEGRRLLREDSAVVGALPVPTISMHAIGDPTVPVEVEDALRDKAERGGSGARLVQVFTREHEHSKLATPEYAALLRALDAWLSDGRKPDAAGIAESCSAAREQYGEECHFEPGYRPAPLAARVYPRVFPF